jgi:Ca-activated chloride channel family protein
MPGLIRRRLIGWGLLLGFVFLVAWFGSARAQEGVGCKLALVLALDVSSSVDDREHHLQTVGTAAALADPEVREAILFGGGGIWFSVFEWSGRNQQVIQLPWTYLDSDAAIAEAAARLLKSERSFKEFPTAVGFAVGFARIHLESVPEPCLRRVIDISGDGINNEGFRPGSAYRAASFAGITVNGLVIKGAWPDPEQFYREEVVRGPGHFIEIANGYGAYAEAMKRKLVREIIGGAVSMR